MKKKILAAVVCAAMVLSLTACGKNPVSGILDQSYGVSSNTSSGTSSKPVSSAAKSEAASSKPASSATESKPESSASKPESSTPESKPDPAAEDWMYTSQYEENTGKQLDTVAITQYKGTDEKVVIPEEIDGHKVTEISMNAFANNIDITSVTIPESITYIDDYAFNDCLNLNEVIVKGEFPDCDLGETFVGTPWLEATLAESNGFVIIGDKLVRAFDNKGSVTIPKNVKKIGSYAFSGNRNITDVTIPEGVTYIGTNAFSGCYSISSVDLPDSLTEIDSYAFESTNLRSVTLPSRIEKIGYKAFFCDFASTVIIPDSVKELGEYAFPYDVEVEYKGKKYIGKGYEQLRDDIEFGDNDFMIVDNVLMKVRGDVKKIQLPDTVSDINDNAFDRADSDIVIVYKGKNYNIANLNKLKAAMNGN